MVGLQQEASQPYKRSLAKENCLNLPVLISHQLICGAPSRVLCSCLNVSLPLSPSSLIQSLSLFSSSRHYKVTCSRVLSPSLHQYISNSTPSTLILYRNSTSLIQLVQIWISIKLSAFFRFLCILRILLSRGSLVAPQCSGGGCKAQCSFYFQRSVAVQDLISCLSLVLVHQQSQSTLFCLGVFRALCLLLCPCASLCCIVAQAQQITSKQLVLCSLLYALVVRQLSCRSIRGMCVSTLRLLVSIAQYM